MKGGKREGAGRKPGSPNKKKRMVRREILKQVRWTEEEWRQIELAAQATMTTPSEFIRWITLTKAQEIR